MGLSSARHDQKPGCTLFSTVNAGIGPSKVILSALMADGSGALQERPLSD
jgi:hypothetical protein